LRRPLVLSVYEAAVRGFTILLINYLNLFATLCGKLTMPFLQQMNGLRRNGDAMKVAAGITIIFFKTFEWGQSSTVTNPKLKALFYYLLTSMNKYPLIKLYLMCFPNVKIYLC